jgi:hypothetical protein
MSPSPGSLVVNIGTLPANKSITITFRAVVANPMPSGTCIISNQATVTAAGGVSILTDDPRTLAPLDATLTAVLVPPLAITQPAAHVTANKATLNGSVNPCGSIARYYFQYGLTTAYGSNTALTSLPAGFTAVPVAVLITGLDAGVTYHFRLVATNDFGTNAGADLTFTTPLTIVQQPASAVVCVGGAATFSVAASSASVTYQWQRREPGTASFADIPGATAASYTTPSATVADDGAAFRAIISTPGTSLASAEAFLSVISVAAPAAIYDFNGGLPPNTAVYGNAFVDSAAGVLELNVNAPGQAGAFLTTDLAPGRIVGGFAATFKARVQQGSFPPADGFSFNWAADLPNGIYVVGEEGEGSGLRVCFDTWENGFAEAPAIDVWWGPNLVARRSVSIPFLVRGPGFFDVQIRLSPDGLLDVLYACEPVFARLPVTGYTPQMGARFGLGSRTGAAWETHSIDDLALELFLDLEGRPRITSIALQPPSGVLITGTGTPIHDYSVEVSTDLIEWSWRASVTADPMGFWQLSEPDIVDPSARFYRLRGAPQFPSGLVAWYRADGDYLDSFGPNHGTPEGGMAFDTGQRGQAFSFDGVAQSIVTDGATIPVPWTAAFWVNRQDTPDVSAALLSDDISALKLEQWPSTRQVGFTQFGVADYYFTYIAPANTWIHLTFVGTFSGTLLYVNGTAIETHPNVINLPLRFMGRRDIGVDRLKGRLDEITVFNRALAPAEVQQVRDATRGP